MPALRHEFHLTWDEIETMPLAELDEHLWWLRAQQDAVEAHSAQQAQVPQVQARGPQRGL